MSAGLLLAVAMWTISTDTLLSKFGGDGQIDYLPSRVFSAQMFKAGALPLWNPMIFSGMPHIAIVQTAVFYPLNVVIYVLLPPALAFNLSTALHFLLLLGFTHGFFRLVTDREEAAWLGAVAFTFCGYLTLHYESTAVFDAAAWIPPFFFCLEKWIRTLSWKYAALGGLCLAMQLLAGWPQMVLLSGLYAGVYALFALSDQLRGVRLFSGIAVMGLLSAGLGAVVILPTMEFKKYSNLAALTYAHFVSLSVAPQSFVQLLFPYIMGADSLTYHAVPYFGSGQLAIAAMYMGVLPLMLAVGALVLWRTSRPARFAAVSALIAAILSFGGYTPLGRVLFRIPVYNFFRDHRIELIYLAFFVAMLAALFAGNLSRMSEQLRQRLSVAVPLGSVGLAALVLIKIRAILGSMNPAINPLDGLWLVRLHQSMRFGNRDMLIAILTLLVSGFVFWRWLQRPTSRVIAQVAIVVVVADLGWFGATDQAHFASARPTSVERAVNEAVSQAAKKEPFRVWSLDREHPYLSPNLNEMTGLDHIFGYSALIPGHYADLLQTDEIGDSPWREIMANNVILSLLNTRFILATEEQWRSVGNILANRPPDSQDVGEEYPEPYRFSANQVVNLQPGRPFDENREFVCDRPPCGFKLTGLLLRKNSMYQLSFAVESRQEHNPSIDVWFMNPKHWMPRAMFKVSNVEIAKMSRGMKHWVFPHLTGDQDEEVDIRFSTESSSPLFLGGALLERVANLPLPNPYREITRHDNIVVLENQNVLPRAFFVSQVTPVYDYNEARARLWTQLQPVDPWQEALVEAVPASVHPMSVSGGTVDRLEYKPNRVTLDVHCPESCYLVLADLFLPGWEARIDGRPTTIYATDGVVQGLFVTSGAHHVNFIYRPKSVTIGVLSTILTWFVVVIMLWRSRRTAGNK